MSVPFVLLMVRANLQIINLHANVNPGGKAKPAKSKKGPVLIIHVFTIANVLMNHHFLDANVQTILQEHSVKKISILQQDVQKIPVKTTVYAWTKKMDINANAHSILSEKTANMQLLIVCHRRVYTVLVKQPERAYHAIATKNPSIDNHSG